MTNLVSHINSLEKAIANEESNILLEKQNLQNLISEKDHQLKEKTGKYRQQVSFLETRVGERQKGISSQTMRLDEMKGNIRKRNDMYSNRVKELNELEDFFIENVFNENEQLLNVIFEKKKMTKDEMIKIYRDAVVEKQCVFNNLVLEYKELERLIAISVVYFAPYPKEYYIARTLKHPEMSALYLNGSAWFEATLPINLKFSNQEVSFSLYLAKSNLVTTLVKRDLKMSIKLFNSWSGESWAEYASGEYTKMLSCSKDEYYCDALVLGRQRFIQSNFYRFQVKLLNANDLYSAGLLSPAIEARFEYTNERYTEFSTYLRAVFMVMSAILFVFYVGYLFLRQNWSRCKTEQKWIILLFGALVFFNNPVYFLDYVSVNFVFPFVNIFFVANFCALFLLFVMIMTNAFVVKPKDRGFWFYAPKLGLVGILWLSVMVSLMYERFNQSTDGSFVLNDLPFFTVFKIMLVSDFALCLLMIGYYVVRSFAENYQKKFKYFGFITFLVILATLVDYLTFFMWNQEFPAQWLSFYPIYNYYMIIVAILFMPSNVIEDDLQEKVKEITEGALQLNEDLQGIGLEMPNEVVHDNTKFSLE